MTGVERDKIVRDYFAIQDMIEELNDQAEAIKDAIKADMVDAGTEELSGQGWSATWHNTVTNRFDSKAFKKEHGDLYEAFKRPFDGTRFTLTKIKSAA